MLLSEISYLSYNFWFTVDRRLDMGFWVFEFLDFWIFGPLDLWTFGLLDFWIFGFLGSLIYLIPLSMGTYVSALLVILVMGTWGFLAFF